MEQMAQLPGADGGEVRNCYSRGEEFQLCNEMEKILSSAKQQYKSKSCILKQRTANSVIFNHNLKKY